MFNLVFLFFLIFFTIYFISVRISAIVMAFAFKEYETKRSATINLILIIIVSFLWAVFFNNA